MEPRLIGHFQKQNEPKLQVFKSGSRERSDYGIEDYARGGFEVYARMGDVFSTIGAPCYSQLVRLYRDRRRISNSVRNVVYERGKKENIGYARKTRRREARSRFFLYAENGEYGNGPSGRMVNVRVGMDG